MFDPMNAGRIFDRMPADLLARIRSFFSRCWSPVNLGPSLTGAQSKDRSPGPCSFKNPRRCAADYS